MASAAARRSQRRIAHLWATARSLSSGAGHLPASATRRPGVVVRLPGGAGADSAGDPMTGSRTAGVLREPGDPQRPTFMELFFDLVFVFMLTQLSQVLL